MAQVLVTEQYLQDIADAIREKNSSENEYTPAQMAGAIEALPDASVLVQKSITANGSYDPDDDSADGYSGVVVNVPNTYSANDEGKVVNNGALVAQTTRSAEITENGTYDTTLNDEVTVNVSGGGGVVLLTRSGWDALSMAEKQAYGLVAIQDTVTGFERGVLVNGADYIPLGLYIPESDPSKVICEAYPQLFDSSKNSWGGGHNPIVLDNNPSLQSDDSVQFLANASKASGYVDLGAVATPFTAYIVAKTTSGTNYRRILSCMNSRGASQGILLYGQTINVSQWGSDTSTGISSTSDYFVGIIQYSSAGNALGAAINANSQTPSFISKTPSTCGRYLTIGRTDIDADTYNAEACDINVKYLAVVSEAESQSVITQNMANLLNEFVLNA